MKKSYSSNRTQATASATSKEIRTKAPKLTPMFESTKDLEQRISRLEQKTIEVQNILIQLKRDMISANPIKLREIEYVEEYTEIKINTLTPIKLSENSLISPANMDSIDEAKIGDLIDDTSYYADDIPVVNADLQVGSVITISTRYKPVV